MKPQDVCIALALAVEPRRTYVPLATALGLSVSEAHGGVRRLQAAGIVNEERAVIAAALVEFLVHGLKYVFPPVFGGPALGVPTGVYAPALSAPFAAAGVDPWVWPTPDGTVRGLELAPLHRGVPKAALKDPALYELFALVDAVRAGKARERNAAAVRLRDILQ